MLGQCRQTSDQQMANGVDEQRTATTNHVSLWLPLKEMTELQTEKAAGTEGMVSALVYVLYAR